MSMENGNDVENGTALEDTLLLASGLSAVLARSGQRIRAYNDLLEDEWEGRPSALTFLQRGQRELSMLLKWNGLLSASLHTLAPEDLFSVGALLEGVSGILQKVHHFSVKVDCAKACYLRGDVTLLQGTILKITERVAELSQCSNIVLQVSTRKLEQNEISSFRAGVEPGRYAMIAVIPDGNAEISYITAMDTCSAVDFGEMDLEILRWIGVGNLHGGEFLVAREGLVKGALMAIPSAEAENDASLRAKIVNGRQETILLVDDEDMIWSVVINILNDLGYAVIPAENGKDAVDIYKANKGQIDLLLMDMVMPVMNAREAFHLLKDYDPKVRVLLASGYVNEEDVRDVLNAGARGFLRKPYSLKELARRIREILDAAD